MATGSSSPNFFIPFYKFPHGEDLPSPFYQTPLSAGADLYAAIPQGSPLLLSPQERCLVPTGIALALPEGMEGQVRPRSGLAWRHGVTLLNSPGTLDADYRGEIKVILWNTSQETFEISRGMRIAQVVFAQIFQGKFHEVSHQSLSKTDRQDKGFGSTGGFSK